MQLKWANATKVICAIQEASATGQHYDAKVRKNK